MHKYHELMLTIFFSRLIYNAINAKRQASLRLKPAGSIVSCSLGNKKRGSAYFRNIRLGITKTGVR